MSDNIPTLLDRPRATSFPSTETEFKSAWQAMFAADMTPFELAFSAGMLADRFAFLFMSGYQSAIRHGFGVEGNRWSALAVSEDRNPENPLPGLTLNAASELDGYKTWVAACTSIDEIIVSAKADSSALDDLSLWRLESSRAGISIKTKDSPPTFLGDMSQGIAMFEQVRVSDEDKVDTSNLSNFSKLEPLYLYAAFCGFIHQQNGPESPEAHLRTISLLLDSDFADTETRSRFADLDDDIQRIMNAIPDEHFTGNTSSDRKLTGLYSKGIQKRAGRG